MNTKLFFLAVVAVMAIVALQIVGSLAHDRGRQRDHAQALTSQQRATFFSPRLRLSFQNTPEVACNDQYLDPTKLDFSVGSQIEERYRGVFPVVLGRHRITGTATFEWASSLPQWLVTTGCQLSKISLWWPQNNSRSVEQRTATWDGKELSLIAEDGALGSWLTLGNSGIAELKFDMTMVGNHELAVNTAAGAVKWQQSSDWQHVSYQNWLPDSHGEDQGTKAWWSMSRHEQKPILQARSDVSDQALIVFMTGVDIYTMMDRAVKYGGLVVIVTLAFLLLFDLTQKANLHIVQYGIVSAGLVLFFLLVLSYSEHIGFAAAYSIASAVIALMSGLYIGAMFSSAVRGGVSSVLVLVLYGAIYVILRAETLALSLGATFLLVLLAGAMWVTRKTHRSIEGTPADPTTTMP